jgi:hypothetical protein
MAQQNEAQMTPQQHAQRIAGMLQEAQRECRADIQRVNDPRAQALFETVAEVLGGTVKALSDYSKGQERAWQASPPPVSRAPQAPAVSDLRVDVDEAEPPPRLKNEMPGHNQ